jgi:hypothetical protein
MKQQGGDKLSSQTWSYGNKQSSLNKLNGDIKP